MKKQKGFTPHHFSLKNSEGFTLIELLVVFALISLLAAIILVALRGTGERAEIAKSLQFEAQIHHALGAYAVGIWNFREGPGNNITRDESGNGNDGTINGATWTQKGDTPSKEGYALEFNGSSDYVSLTAEVLLSLSKNHSGSVWVYPETTGTYSTVIGNTIKSNDRFSVAERGGLIVIGHYDGTQIFKKSGSANMDFWNHVAWSFDTATLRLWIDGVEQTGTQNPAHGWRVGFRIGSTTVDNFYFKGLIDDVRIYSESLTQAQVKKLYAEGARKRGLLAGN